MTFENYKQKASQYNEKFENLPWDNPDYYAKFLAQTFHFVKYSTRIISYAMAKLPAEKQQSSYKRLLETINEESFHDTMCLRDIEHLGYNIENYEMLPSTKALFAVQFFNIDNYGVAAYFGYALGLEMIAAICGESVYYKVENHYDAKSLTFLKLHVFEDQKHIVDAHNAVSQLSEKEQEICWDIYQETLHLYEQFTLAIANEKELHLQNVA